MADTTVPVAIVSNVAASVGSAGVVIFGIHTGLDYPTLIAGVFGGAMALSYLEPSSAIKRAFEVLSASLFAGYSSPVSADILFGSLRKFGVISETAVSPYGLPLIVAFLTGYLAHGVILPGLRTVGAAIIRRHSSG